MKWLCVVLLAGMSVSVAMAQEGDAQASCSEAVTQGAEAVREGKYAAAIARLHAVVAAEPACFSPDAGAAAYWLGKAYKETGELSNARQVWERAAKALQEAGLPDVRLIEEYLALLAVQAPLAFREEATPLYEQLLATLAPDAAPWAMPVLRRHASYCAPLLDTGLHARIVTNPHEDPEAWQFQSGAGASLLAWWRRQDPLPGTLVNERVVEHLIRVAHVQEAYPDASRLAGFDDRGRVYLQYGKPTQVHTIQFNDLNFLQEVVRFGVPVQPNDFPQNEIWVYPHIDWAGNYIFIRDAGVYRLATATDLLPSKLRGGFNSSVRSHNTAFSSLAALRYIYGELAQYYSTFGNLLGDLDGLYSLQEHLQDMVELIAQRGEAVTLDTQTGEGKVADGVEQRGYLSGAGFASGTPSSAAVGAINQSQSQERHLQLQREERMPDQYTEVLRDVVRLPVAVRTARFLDADGATRTEVYWGVAPGSLTPTERQQQQIAQAGLGTLDHLLRVSVVQRTPDYQARRVYVNHVRVPAQETVVPVQTVTVTGDRETYHLGLQWDQFLVSPEAPEKPLLQLRLTTGASDSLRALSADPAKLEMSDIKPLLVLNDDPNLGPENTRPFPGTVLSKSTPLALYFEVYHLMLLNDEARFTVEYEVRRRSDGGLLRLWGREQGKTTSARVGYRGAARTAREYILLDPGAWENAGEIELTLRITDEATGTQLSRAIRFEVR